MTPGLETRVGYQFTNQELLRLALTHPSVGVENQQSGAGHNQRLEYLGDAVIQLALSADLYSRFPHLDEGALTKLRSQMVNEGSLARLARSLDLGDCLILGKGEAQSGGRGRDSTLADAFEALIGAMFIDGGYEPASAAIRRLFAPELQETPARLDSQNPKGELQEFLQATAAEPPRYETLRASGPDHARVFECAVRHGEAELGRGIGPSKRIAEAAAARAALEALRQSGPTPPTAPVSVSSAEPSA